MRKEPPAIFGSCCVSVVAIAVVVVVVKIMYYTATDSVITVTTLCEGLAGSCEGVQAILHVLKFGHLGSVWC